MEYFGAILIVCLLILSSVGAATAQATTDPSEVAALNAILGRWKQTTAWNANLGRWKQSANLHWNISGEPCSGWAIDSTDLDDNEDFNPGIKCDCTYNSNKTCHIVKLQVYGMYFFDAIPDELQNLSYLTYLNLAQNSLTGPLPAFMGKMTRMQNLSIGNNGLSGSVPKELGNLQNLISLSIGNNGLSGSVPKELGNLQNLISLGMGSNNFIGTIPDEFGNLTNLQELYIDSSGLSGELPETLSYLINMKILWASDNAFTGKMPDYIGTWTGLQDLQLQGNYFHGPIPSSFSSLVNLTNLNLRQNYLSGPLPALGKMTRMQNLDISINALSGSVPKELGNLQNLISLGMGTNNLSGPIPDEFGNLTNLQELYIDSSGLSGELPATLSNLINMKILWASDNAFTGKMPDYIGTWTGLQDLRFQGNSFQGPIPSSFSNLVNLTSLRIGDIADNTSSKLDFFSNLTSLIFLILRNCKISDTLPTDFSMFKSLQLLDLSFNNITGEVPQSLFSLSSLKYLFLGNNSLSGSLPSQKSDLLVKIDLSYNLLSGAFPSWVSQHGYLPLNLVANNFVIEGSNSSVWPSGLECLQRDFPCNKDTPFYSSFAINCGAGDLTSQDGTWYQSDNIDLFPASYYVSDETWGVSNMAAFIGDDGYSYYQKIIATDAQFQNTPDTGLFQNARMSPSSLRYYGIGLQNGNYTVKLQFSEITYPDPPPFTWQSMGRRVFDIFIQGALKEKDFDIRKNAGGRSFVAVVRKYTVPVTNNFIEIHFFWAGKGTCCVPTQGNYGPIISAISVSPFSSTTFSNAKPGSSKNKESLIVGVVLAVTILGLIAVLAILYWRHKKKMSDIDKDLLGIVDRRDVFSYAELRTATDAFNASNILGKGGYGPVYKGKLFDGRIVAVKQLAVTSRQGKREFLTEIATISAVQHKNLVKLYGCCVEGNTPLLVYEYLENGSLDKPLFGNHTLCLDWATRFEICLGVARGLAYLHEESSVRIIHRDIKASNILIDGDLNPKISDFGLAKFYDDKKTHISTRVAGTLGYLAPEYAMRGQLTEKTDVFAFGVVALEVVTGRSISDPKLDSDQIYLFEWAWSLYEQNHAIGLLDPKLASYDEDQALRLIGVSLLCTQASLLQRPSMSRVVSILNGHLEVSKVSSRPSYLTDWRQSSASRGVHADISRPHSSEVLLDSIIQEGR